MTLAILVMVIGVALIPPLTPFQTLPLLVVIIPFVLGGLMPILRKKLTRFANPSY